MAKMLKGIGLFCLVMLQLSVWAQTQPEERSMMESNGKIYVVMAVVLTIMLGIILYMVNLDRKISRLENKKDL